MYYLLETNYIISENEIKELGFKIVDNTIGKWEKLDGKLGIKNWFNVYGFIKKQSDNVFDLIEVGDLIGLNKSIGEVLSIQISSGDKFIGVSNEKSSLFNIKYLNNKINAIYKPNANGDYIKVWEKESE